MVVRHNGLRNSLPNGVDLSSRPSALSEDSDVHIPENMFPNEKDRLLVPPNRKRSIKAPRVKQEYSSEQLNLDFHPQGYRLYEVQRNAIDTNHPAALVAGHHSDGVPFPTKGHHLKTTTMRESREFDM